MYSYRFAIPILFTAMTAAAADQYSTFTECSNYFTASIGVKSGQTAPTYCADKLSSPSETCVATKLTAYFSANKTTSFANLINSEQLKLASNYNYQCQVEAQNAASAAQQQATLNSRVTTTTPTGSTTAASGSGTSATGSASSPSINPSQLTGVANALGNSSNNNSGNGNSNNNNNGNGGSQNSAGSSAGDQAQATTASSGGGIVDSVKSGINSVKEKLGFGDTKSTTPDSTTSSKVDDVNGMDLQSDQSYAARTGADSSSAGYVNGMDLQSDLAAAKSAQTQVQANGAVVKAEMPQLAPAVDGVKKSATVPPDVKVPGTAITGTSEAAAKALQAAVTSAASAAKPFTAPGKLSVVPFSFTETQFATLKTKIEAYLAAKKVCTSRAETAQFLCAEGTSPGAVAVSTLMNVAGPVLALISSAQKTCSSTGKISELANAGLTVAKGVCVGAKLLCDTTCSSNAAEMKTIATTATAEFQAMLGGDVTNASSACAALTLGAPACAAEVAARQTGVTGTFTNLFAALNKEGTPAPGATPAIVAKCGSMIKDIALFAVQAGGTFMAMKKAKECEQALATNSTAGAAVTTQQYCEVAANVTQQLCICQKNNMATGCPGAIAALTSGANKETGTNIKSAAGNSAFAGFKPTGGGTGSGGIGGLGGLAGDLKGASSDRSDGGSLAGGGGSGSGAGGGSGLSAPGASADEEKTKKSDDPKKWAFGAFSGGAGGGYGGGAGAANNGKSGALSAKDTDAIQRQIASEKISAEVSAASGKSNWEKVRSMYLIKEGSFILGQ